MAQGLQEYFRCRVIQSGLSVAMTAYVVGMESVWMALASAFHIGAGRIARALSSRMIRRAVWMRHVEDMAVAMWVFVDVTWDGVA